VLKFSAADVRKWAVETVGLDAEDADILAKQKIDGEALLEITEEKLVQDRMPRGQASKLMKAVNALLLGDAGVQCGAFNICMCIILGALCGLRCAVLLRLESKHPRADLTKVRALPIR
jgi:hypothetical protein